ncbi:MAG: D-tyrosyl-tRNA(Tyr) deacylase [Bacteroidales bacterium]|jgi:D-tyrosyl-tRNA(Tyr) deacylase|nr:D-tyrosyl-tRNA(Tyr) deacylase [Bacteroidales bacterium]
MRTVTQRVSHASVTIDGEMRCSIDRGLLVLVGFEAADTQEDVAWMAHKLLALRIFDDERGVMNRSVMDVGGEVCIVSQFTLHALTAKGNRPAYIRAAGRDIAVPLYESFVHAMEQGLGRPVSTGIFGANMQVELVNDGPVTIIIDTKNKE